jgi:asparagine N-glycosylation enzyme membrane subunit Stt3
MDAVTEVAYQTPMILRALCYLGGMSVFLGTMYWLARLALGKGNVFTLKETVGLWSARILAVLAMLSLGLMLLSWPGLANKLSILPEAATLILLAALFLLTQKDKGFVGLLGEALKALGVTALCLAGWALSFALGVAMYYIAGLTQGPPWFPVFATGVLWLAGFSGLYAYAHHKNRTDGLKFHQVLWPLLLGFIFVMLPDLLEHLAHSPKVHEIMQAPPRLQRA